MIDEKKLIEEIQRQINIEHKKCNEFVALNVGDLVEKYNHGEYCYVNVLHLVQSQPKVGEWIPCSERLPDGCSDAEIEVIVSIHEPYSETVIDDSGFALYYPGTNKFHSVYGDRLDITEDVIAWQPLPEPYNAERGGKNESR